MNRDLLAIAAFALAVAVLPLASGSGVLLNLAMTVLYAALMAQAWNLLGGYGGQFSFGHALFFGTGAYAQVIAQLQWGLNPWPALALAVALAAGVGLFVGALSFRYGLRGSYFALVTLAFAEVFRVTALSVPFTGAGVGLMLPLRAAPANMQFASRAGFVWLALALVVIALLLTAWLRHSRFGACLQAVRDNEDAARAIGVDPFRAKLGAIALSAALMGAAGAFYVQVFQYIDPGIAFGPHTSVEALVAAIVGGMGTLWGPVLGALTLHLLAEATRNLFGNLPGLNMVIYGSVLVLIVMFAPRGVVGTGRSVRGLWARRGGPHD
ncbi:MULTISPECIES: branched-chain amino acid ABC transporter permease [Ramlibacter]|uniref:Branched-chain amino acid ABC transporter permease n=1 Tax=Ramlibacter pinisoli TaxID=2682844 RepID=A0A6N8IUT7_9BURK|nr:MULTISPECIES: branched-chain amino acid ABC transporter permease [Ramlibacter]MBA2965351.1 branched-chain amino acid ABC transporter permease [Ramlibacter sp. CGMCC 1.13660]MVQ30315.1 branched-chain amino acid ABC transporter permease [Ramlibacter pinisoli]